ncbi:MFS transporter [Saccharopolyspora indica]|nr:MFS transporter [Saccharopolyspora indica]MDA3645303.1 MFS transporter [Saccharopolyspora indica]
MTPRNLRPSQRSGRQGFFTWIPTLLVQQGITVTKSFEFSIIIYLAQVPGYFSAAWLGEYLDRKNTIALYSYTPEVFPTWIRASGTGLSSAFGRFGSIIAPSVIGIFAASLGFAGVFGITTAVLAVGVICTPMFGLSTAGRSLEDLTEPDSPKAAVR